MDSRLRALLSAIILSTSQAALAAIGALAEIAEGQLNDTNFHVVLAHAGTQLRGSPTKLDPRVREDDGFEANGIIPDSSVPARE